MSNEICFVIMPSDDKLFNTMYDLAIKPAVESGNMECIRVDKIPGGGNITGDIVEHIHKAGVVIADLTAGKPEILYELGLAHGLLNNVIMLTQNIDELPFDLKNYRVIEYHTGLGGDKVLKEEIIKSIETLDNWSEKSNPVKTFLPPDIRSAPASGHTAVRQELETSQAELDHTKKELSELRLTEKN